MLCRTFHIIICLLSCFLLSSCFKGSIDPDPIIANSSSNTLFGEDTFATHIKHEKYLFQINQQSLSVYELINGNPLLVNEISVRNAIGMELYYPYLAVMGVTQSNLRMSFFDITNPVSPIYKFQYTRLRCQEVAIQSHVLYSTSSSSCGLGQDKNRIGIFDIKSEKQLRINAPQNFDIGTYQKHIYLACKDSGLIILNAQDSLKPYLVNSLKSFKVEKLEIENDRLYARDTRFIYQFSLNNLQNPTLLGVIKLK